MQKFVCRQATDVSDLLPLPIPSNSRQEKNLRATGQRGLSAEDGDERRAQTKLVMATLGKVHAIVFAIKQTSPALYSEFLSTLNLKGEGGGVSKGSVDRLKKQLLDASFQMDEAKVARQACSLTSHSALPFALITHGWARADGLTFKLDERGGSGGRAVSVKLPGLTRCRVGSPLLDVVSFLLSLRPADVGHQLLPQLLLEYHDSFGAACKFLRVSTANVSRRQLAEDLRDYLMAGAIVNAATAAVRPNETEEEAEVPCPSFGRDEIEMLRGLQIACDKAVEEEAAI